MKTRLSSITIFAVLSLASSASSSGIAEDHLFPPDLTGDGVPDYRPLLGKKLMVTSADCGRLLVLPSPASLGENSVAVFSRGSQCYITYTKAARNLWYQKMNQDHPIKDDPYASSEPIKITRIDSPFPTSTALAVRRVWKEMLRRVAQGSQKGGVERVVLDGTDFEFWLVDGTQSVGGTIPPGIDGKNTSALLKIGRLLIDYCETGTARRSRIAEEIESKANHLVSGLR
jgi:hypothetical protein